MARFSIECRDAVRIVQIGHRDWPELVESDISFETLITDTIDRIVAQAPSGPLRIAGYSTGGKIAYAAAVALSTAGRSVKFLGVLDTPQREELARPGGIWSNLGDSGSWVRLAQYVRQGNWEEVYHHVLPEQGLLNHVLPESLLERPAAKWLLRHFRWLRDVLPIGIQIHLSRSLRVSLLRRWSPPVLEKPPEIRCFLFRAENNLDDLGWRDLCKQLTVIPVSGDHFSMLDNRHRPLLCRRFVEAVRETLGPEPQQDDHP